MKILYLITGMFNSAGMERTVANKANYFSERGHDVTIITTDQCKQEYFYYISPMVTKVDLDIDFSKEDDRDIITRTLVFYKKNKLFKKRLKEYLCLHKQDVVVSLMFKSVDFLYKIKDGSIKIIEHHFSRDIYIQQSEALQWGLLKKIIYKVREYFIIHNLARYACFVVLTHEDAVEWRKCLKNVIVMPNSIEYHKELLAPLQNKIVVSIGRLDYQKGYDLFLPIWKAVVSEHPEWKLSIYGNGVMRDALFDKIEELDLISSVSIYDSVTDVNSVLMEGDLCTSF